MKPTLSSQEARFVAFAAELAESLSLSGALAQIYALLFIRSHPLSLGEIADLLRMSKGHASVNLRVLESWGAVRPAWIPGNRRDHYEPVRDLKALVLRRVEEGLGRRLAVAEERLKTILEEAERKSNHRDPDREFLAAKVKGLYGEVAWAKGILKMVPGLVKLRRVLG